MGKRDPELEAKWRATISSWEKSGQTVKAFCRDRELSDSAFHSWRRELRRRDGHEPRAQSRRVATKGSRSRFVQLQVTSQTSSLQIRVGNDLTIDVPATVDRQTLAEIITAVRMAASC